MKTYFVRAYNSLNEVTYPRNIGPLKLASYTIWIIYYWRNIKDPLGRILLASSKNEEVENEFKWLDSVK